MHAALGIQNEPRTNIAIANGDNSSRYYLICVGDPIRPTDPLLEWIIILQIYYIYQAKGKSFCKDFNLAKVGCKNNGVCL